MKRLRATCLLACTVGLAGAGPVSSTLQVYVAVMTHNVAAAQNLAGKGADFSGRDNEGRSLLFLVARSGDVNMVRFLLKQKPDLDARSLLGETPLHAAVLSGDARTVDLILKAGSSPRTYTKACLSPLDYASGWETSTLFDLLHAATAKSPLPTDGTVDECHLKPELSDFAGTQAAFYRRILTVASRDDYRSAASALYFLAEHPKVGERHLDEVLASLDQPAIPGTESDEIYDQLHRTAVARTLVAIARTKPVKDRVAKGLLRKIERGPCPVFTATACNATSCDARSGSQLVALAKKLLNGRPAWPLEGDEQLCYDCTYCATTRVGHAYDAALLWFAANPSYRPKAEAVMARQVKAKLLKIPDFQQKKRLLAQPPRR